MQKAAYKVKIGSTIFDSSTSQEIISINLDLDIDIPSDSFKITLKPGTKASSIRNGDPVIIELGYDDALNRVLTGAVDTIEPSISEVAVTGLSAVSMLTAARVNQVYKKQSAGAIVKDLAERGGIAVKVAEEGISFPMYVVDDTKDVYMHMMELARKCGFDLFMSADSRLVFKKYARQAPRPFKYGRDIIQAEAYEPLPIAASVKVYGESPASFKGADTSHWITKRLVEGVVGSGDVTFHIEDPVIRDKDSADKAATAYLETIMTQLSGTLKALGNAHVGLGDTIEIKDMPDSKMNGEFEASSVSHIFNKAEGFVSIIGWVKKVTISKAEAPLAAAPPPASPKPPSPLEKQLESAQNDLEDKRLKLQDAVENAEMELEHAQFEINKSVSEQDKLSREMVAAAEDARKTAKEAAKEVLDKAEELEKELEAKKKEMEDAHKDQKEGGHEAKKKFDETGKEVRVQIDEMRKTAENMEKEAEEMLAQVRKNAEEAKKEAVKKLEDIKKSYKETRDKTIEARKQAGLD